MSSQSNMGIILEHVCTAARIRKRRNMPEEFESIDLDAVVAQLQHENEELRVKLTQAMKSSTINDAVDNIIVLVQKTDPMQLYIWVSIACLLIMVGIRIIELFIK
jgi:hypothetical protein